MIRTIFLLFMYFAYFPAIGIAESYKHYKGITIIPVKEMGLPDYESKKILAEIQEQKTKGYIEENNNEAQMMIANSKIDEQELKINPKNNNPLDTHLKKSLTEIKLAFTFNDINISEKNIIGYAAMGTYVNNGWTGISEYFKDDIMGICSYDLLEMNLSKGSNLIASESVTYYIHSKPTIITVKGSSESGFIYNVSWCDDNYNHILECANMKFDKAITAHMLSFAEKID